MKTVKESFKSPSLSGFLWRLLKAVTMRLVLESFKSLVLAGFFWDFLWLFFTFCYSFSLFETVSFYITKTVTLKSPLIHVMVYYCKHRLPKRSSDRADFSLSRNISRLTQTKPVIIFIKIDYRVGHRFKPAIVGSMKKCQ
jgi:hypothetical protein